MNNKLLPEFDIKTYFRELIRPWKLCSFFIALGYYIWGACHYKTPTWDVPISIIMSTLTYLIAPRTVDVIYYVVTYRPPKWISVLVMCGVVIYSCASGSYELYNLWNIGYWPPPTYWVNLYYSSLMFIAAGMLWRFKGTLKDLFGDLHTSCLCIYRTSRK